MITRVIVDGNKKIDEIERAIAGAELDSMKFVRNEMSTDGGSKTNKVVLEELDDFVLLNEFKLTIKQAAALNGYTKIWGGEMFVEGKEADVTAWRKDAGS